MVIIDCKVFIVQFDRTSRVDWYHLLMSLFLLFVLSASLVAPLWLKQQPWLLPLDWLRPETWMNQVLHGRR